MQKLWPKNERDEWKVRYTDLKKTPNNVPPLFVRDNKGKLIITSSKLDGKSNLLNVSIACHRLCKGPKPV